MSWSTGYSFTWRAADHADDSDGHFEPGGVAQHEADEHEEGERVSRTPTRWRGFGMLKVKVGQWSLGVRQLHLPQPNCN